MKPILLATLTGVACALLVTTAHAAPRTYEVTVTNDDGSQFSDCFRFDTPADGDLTIDGLGQTLLYRKGGLNKLRRRFKAVTKDDGFEIMFFGRFTDHRSILDNGEAVSDEGASFAISGIRNDACATSPASASPAAPANPYSH